MSITPCAIDPRRAEPPAETPYAVVDPAEKLRKRVYTGFAASAGIVLVIAICYVAVRVFSQPGNHSRRAVTAKVAPPISPPPIRIQTLAPTPAPAPPEVVQAASVPPKVQPQAMPALAPAPKPDKSIGSPAPGQAWTAVTPHTGETYLQVIALNERFVQSYVDGLRAKGLHPLVAISPLDNVYRILFGPLKDRHARDLEQKDLEAAGLQPLVQVY